MILSHSVKTRKMYSEIKFHWSHKIPKLQKKKNLKDGINWKKERAKEPTFT